MSGEVMNPIQVRGPVMMDITERLDAEAGRHDGYTRDLLWEAEAEIKRLREHRDHMRAVVECAGFESVTEALVEIDRLRAEAREQAMEYITLFGQVTDALDGKAAAEARLAEAVEVVREDHEHMHRLCAILPGNDTAYGQNVVRMAEIRAFLAKLEGRSGE